MKAVVCNEPFSLNLTDRTKPRAGDGEVLVRIRRVGLCGTDFHIFSGKHPFLEYPRVMGHELAGEVEEAPEGSGLAPGQLVAINPYLACGVCIACRNGRPNACVNIRVLGVHMDGGMCDYLAVPADAVIDASGLSIDQAAMLEFLAIGAHAASRGAIRPGDRVLVVGAGPIGVATGLFARITGAKVALADTRQARLDHARMKLGFDDVFAVDPDLSSALRDLTAGDMFDAVFDATGSLDAMRQSLTFVAHGGRLIYVGVAQGDLVLSDPEFHKRETTLLASRNALRADFERVIAAVKSGEIDTGALHTHSLDAEELKTRIPELIADADNVLKAIARF